MFINLILFIRDVNPIVSEHIIYNIRLHTSCYTGPTHNFAPTT